ncbi:hypothetical protein AcW1_000704 [Taiwanofungus camphoratus]|nr:hypothetical protein AcW1_000704 [Antrodia cinnamomea]
MDILAVSSSVLEALTIRTFGEGTSAPSKSKPQIKATADLFETVIGAYYMDHGFESLCSWVRGVYTPLIVAAKKAFDDCQAVGRIRKRPRHNTYLGDISGRLGKRPKLVKSPIKRKVLPLRSKLKAIRPAQTPEDAVRQFAATSNPEPIATCFSTDRLPVSGTTGTERRHSPEKYLTPTVIDLTLTSDSSDAEGSHATKARRAITSQPRRRIPSHRARKPAMITIDPTSKNGVDVGPEEDDSSSNDEFLLEQMLTVEIDINVESNGQVSSYGG